MKYVYGPVPSRRLGQSLGIDPLPLKTCNWNCVYCQLGRTRPVTNERKDYVPPEDVIAEAREALAAHGPGEIDWVTFLGSGEPLLHASLGSMIREVKESDAPHYLLLTECSMGDNIIAENPEKEMLRLCSVRCPHMNEITLEDTLQALKKTQYVVEVPEDIRVRAKRAVDRMVEIG